MSKKGMTIIGIIVVVVIAVLGFWQPWKGSSSSAAGQTAQATQTTAKAVSGSQHKVLVVVYSAQNHTKKVAETIAKATNGDLMELQPKQPYTKEDLNYRDSNSRVVHEHDNPSMQDIPLVTTTPKNWDQYDVVFVGYPIWWGIAAWPVNNFVKGNYFNGKTVIPFATSISSGIGESDTLLAKMAGTGKWMPGMRFDENPSDSEVSQWLKAIGF